MLDNIFDELPETREGSNIEHLVIPASSSETTGFDCMFARDVVLTGLESNALGLIKIGNSNPKVDLVLLDYPTENKTFKRLWESFISSDTELSTEAYAKLRESLIPKINNNEILDYGITVNTQSSRSMNQSPYNIFLNDYLTGISKGKKALIILGHGDTEKGKDRFIGSLDNRSFDYPHHLYNNLALDEYCVILDSTCADSEYTPSEKIRTNSASIFSPMSSVIFLKGNPNELQCASTLLKNGTLTRFNWREIIMQRRNRGEMININY